MSKFEFFDSLNEARALRRLSSVKGESVPHLTSRLFNHFVALRVLYTIDPSAAVAYAKETVAFSAFDLFKSSSTDLYNLVVLVMRQYEFADTVFNEWAIKLPEMRTRRVLKAFAANRVDFADFDELMLIVQRQTSLNSLQVTMRRHCSAFETLSKHEQSSLIKRLLLLMREDSVQSDLYYLLKSAATRADYL